MSRQSRAAKNPSPATNSVSPGSVLPARYIPKVAGYAGGPFLEPELVTPSGWQWYDVKTYVVRHSDGLDYRAVRVSSEGVFIGYWAVELLGTPLMSSELD